MKRFLSLILIFIICLTTALVGAGCFWDKKDDNNDEKTTIAMSDANAMAISRVKNADYNPNVAKMIGVKDSSTSSVMSYASKIGMISSPCGATVTKPNDAITKADLKDAPLALGQEIDTVIRDATSWGKELKTTLFSFIDKAVVFDKWISDSSSSSMPLFMVKYDAKNDKVTVYMKLGDSFNSIGYYFDEMGMEVVESYFYIIEGNNTSLIEYCRYTKDTEFLSVSARDNTIYYNCTNIQNGILNFDRFYKENNQDASIIAIRQEGDLKYCFWDNNLEYQINNNTLFRIKDIGHDQTDYLNGYATQTIDINAEILNNWDFYLRGTQEGSYYYGTFESLNTDFEHYKYRPDSINNPNIWCYYYPITERCSNACKDMATKAALEWDTYEFDTYTREEYIGSAISNNVIYYNASMAIEEPDRIKFASNVDYIQLITTENVSDDMTPIFDNVKYVKSFTSFAKYDAEQQTSVSFNNGQNSYFYNDKILFTDYISLYDDTIERLSEDNCLMTVNSSYRQYLFDAIELQKNGFDDLSICGVNQLSNTTKQNQLTNLLKNNFSDSFLENIQNPTDLAADIDLDKVDITTTVSSFTPSVSGNATAQISSNNASISLNNVNVTVSKNVLMETGKSYNAVLILTADNKVVELDIKSTAVIYAGEDMTFALTGSKNIDVTIPFNTEYKLAVVIVKNIDNQDRFVSNYAAISNSQSNETLVNDTSYIAANFNMTQGVDYSYGYGFKNVDNTLVVVKNGTDITAPTISVADLTFNEGVSSTALSLPANSTIADLLSKITVADNIDTVKVRISNLGIYSMIDDEGEFVLSNFEIDEVGTKSITGYSAKLLPGVYGYSITDGAGNSTTVIFIVTIG